MSIEKKQKINQLYWYEFSTHYLTIAELVCQELLDGDYDKKNKAKQLKSDYSITELYVPIIFNMKHSIELLVKALKFMYHQKENTDGGDKTHNSKKIFNDLSVCLDYEKIKNELIKFAELGSKSEISKYIAKTHKTIPSEVKELSRIIYKYQHLTFLNDKILSNFEVDDFKNTAFKYPTNDLTINLNYDGFFKKITKTDVIEIRNDIGALDRIGWLLHLAFFVGTDIKNTK